MPRGNPNSPRRRFPARDPRRPGRVTGAPVVPLPIVITVGVNAVANTSVNVIGSVNPNGSDTSWWIAYGTSLPLSPGTTTSSAPIGSGTTPITATTTLTGLTTNATYYVAVVGQSTAGTVYGQPVSFVAQVATTTPTTPPAPFGQPFVTIPHFNMPFRLVTTGAQSGAIVVEQDTVEEVFANVATIVSCQIGQCPQLPDFGRPDMNFVQGPPDTSGLTAAVRQWEPRANEDAVAQLMNDEQTWGITMSTSYTGAEGV